MNLQKCALSAEAPNILDKMEFAIIKNLDALNITEEDALNARKVSISVETIHVKLNNLDAFTPMEDVQNVDSHSR